MARFAHVSFGNRPVVTFRGEARNFPVMAARMDGSTLKRRLVRRVAPWLGVVLSNREGGRPAAEHEVEHVAGPMLAVARDHNIDVSSWMIMWPAGDRRHRRYVMGFGAGNRPLLFSKVSQTPTVDGPMFEHEASILKALENNHLQNWRTPQVYDVARHGDLAAITFQALPAGGRNLTWSEIKERLPLRLETDAEGQLRCGPDDGSPSAGQSTEIRARHLTTDTGRSQPKGIVHADVRPSNAIRIGSEHWLVDWEFASLCGPADCDVVAASLNNWHETGSATEVKQLRDAVLAECVARGIERAAVVDSFDYLATVGNPRAAGLVDADRGAVERIDREGES